jgi:hypothetical protein
VVPKPNSFWRAEDYQVKKVATLSTYEDKDTIDLGDKKFEVFVRGSIL